MDLYKVDIRLQDDYSLTATGDLQTIEGILNLKESIYRRIITNPGELLHRPKYGVGIKRYLGLLSTESNKNRLQNAIKLNIQNEKRISKILSIKCDWTDEGVAYIEIKTEAYGQQVTFEYEVSK